MSRRPDTSPRPAVDQRLVMPETRFEVVDGEVLHVSPADQPHASRHSKLSALLEAYVAPGYDAACDMLTRTSLYGDMAPDGSVYPSDPDPKTGGRQLEELAFEVVSTETLGDAGTKGARLTERGVRRVFALDVGRRRVLEWDRETEAWKILADDEAIEDRALILPLPVEALILAAKADDAMARALLAKGNPVLVAAMTEATDSGHARGRVEALLAVLRGRGLVMTSEQEARIAATSDPATVDRWLAACGTCDTVAELLRS